MAQAWSPAWMRLVLGLPELETPPDSRFMAECYVDLIAGPTQTGYKYVYKVGKRFQAKPYVRLHVQRSLATCLASCESAEAAAAEIVLLAYDMRPLPPSPVKDTPKIICKPKRQRVKATASRALPISPIFPLHAYELVKTCIDLYELSSPALYQCSRPLCDGEEAHGRCPGDVPGGSHP